jgi:hypothetical protein
MRKIAEILSSKKEVLNEEDQQILQKLIKKLHSFSHAPLNRKHCLRMQPFSESAEVSRLVGGVIKSYELKLMNNSCHSDFDIIGYYYCIALLACCVAFEKDNIKEIYSVLENEVIKNIKKNSLAVKRGGENRSVMARVLTYFKKDTNQLDKLVQQLEDTKLK